MAEGCREISYCSFRVQYTLRVIVKGMDSDIDLEMPEKL